MNIVIVGIGGFIGAAARYIISTLCSKNIEGSIPYGTLIVNIIGAIIIGFILTLVSKTNLISSELKLFLTTGVMGGLTTFSTFSYETITLIHSNMLAMAFLNIGLNLVLSLFGVLLGENLSKILIN